MPARTACARSVNGGLRVLVKCVCTITPRTAECSILPWSCIPMCTTRSRSLLHKEITYEEANSAETNILQQLGYPEERSKLYYLIYEHRDLIQRRVALHLGLRSASACRIEDPKTWRHGTFNFCVPVTVDNERRVLIRFPLPYRIGDKACPGNSDEKLRCEAATYAWMQQKCPGVQVPSLYGFALSTGQSVRDPEFEVIQK